MEDYGVFCITVKDADSVGSIAVAPTTAGTVEVGAIRTYTATVSGATGCVDLAFIEDASYPATPEGGLADADANGRADLATAAAFPLVNGTPRGTSYVDCVTVAGGISGHVRRTLDDTECANVRPVVFRDENSNNAMT